MNEADAINEINALPHRDPIIVVCDDEVSWLKRGSVACVCLVIHKVENSLAVCHFSSSMTLA